MPEIVIQLPDVDIDTFDEDALLNHFVDYAKPAFRKAIRQWLEHQKPVVAGKNPFAVSFDEFAKLSIDEQRKLRHQALRENRDWIDQQLTEHNAEWILVLGGIVEHYSMNLDELPSKQEIYQIAEHKGFAPFAFVKDALVEEHSTSRWALIGRDDYYSKLLFFSSSESLNNTTADIIVMTPLMKNGPLIQKGEI